MIKVRLLGKKFLTRFLAVVLSSVLSGALWGQSAPAQQQDQGQGQDQSQVQGQGQRQADNPALSGTQGSAAPTQGPSTPPPAAQEKDEVKITPREAEELFHSVDEILAFDSKHT